MAKFVLRTDLEQAQSKLQENFDEYSSSVLPRPAEKYALSGLKAGKTNSPSLYIVGDVSPTHPSIPFHHIENLIQAAAYARLIAKPLYHHLTIRWPNGNWQHHEPILRHISEWQRYHIGMAAFIWSKEAKGGPHSHILLHLPGDKSRKFRAMVAKQLKNRTGLRSLPKGTIQNRHIWSHGDPFKHMRNRIAYILKRADEDTRKMMGVKKPDFGPIDGKQTGVSQSLGEAARRKAKSVLPFGHRRCPHPLRHV